VIREGGTAVRRVRIGGGHVDESRN
jgi:hypothetical protein